VRPTTDYAAGHLRGSLAIPLRGVFATWLGWLLPDPRTPIVIVRNPDQDPDEIVWQALKVGYRIGVEVAGGVAAWAAEGGSVVATRLADPATVDPATVIDVRQRAEFVAGHVPGAANVELGTLGTVELPDGPVVTMCGHGERAATGASVLERTGRTDVAVMPLGPPEWARAANGALEVTPWRSRSSSR